MNKILITICARGGSKGIPGKNIKELNGKPLIYYTIKVANEFSQKFNADVSLSTDSLEIKETAKMFGLLTDYIRPKELATDTAGKIAVIKLLLEYEENKRGKNYDYIIDLDVTSPLRTIGDLCEAYNLLQNNEDAINIFSVSPAKRNPYFNMVEEVGNDGFVGLVKNNRNIKSRQTAPKVFDMNASFYIFRRGFFRKGYEISITDKSLAYVVPHTCFDLDEPEDFTIMSIMLRENLLNFVI